MDILKVRVMNREFKYILNLAKEDLIKIILEYKAKEQDYKLQNQLFKQLIKNYADLSNELKFNIRRVTNLSETDPLTKIYNRIKFNEELARQIKIFENQKVVFSVIMFDIDHFKNVNDTFGHDVGDMVLRILCEIVQSCIREKDIFARWGGEEFMILMANDNLNMAENVAERIRQKIQAYNFKQVKNITCSFGVTEFRNKDKDDTFTKRVDEALYVAKHHGRNCVVTM